MEFAVVHVSVNGSGNDRRGCPGLNKTRERVACFTPI